MTVIVIVFIVAAMLLPAFRTIQGRAERQNCVGNLKSLYAAGSAYVQDQGHWPQVDTKDVHRPTYALQWIQAFTPYGISAPNWICPTVQRQLHDPDYKNPSNARVDYLATPFDDGPRTPYKWPTHPWFVERGDVHGDGQMVIFTNAEVKSLKEIFRNPVKQSVESFP
jgi:type II secretory pathway pseudopilin PulG